VKGSNWAQPLYFITRGEWERKRESGARSSRDLATSVSALLWKKRTPRSPTPHVLDENICFQDFPLFRSPAALGRRCPAVARAARPAIMRLRRK